VDTGLLPPPAPIEVKPRSGVPKKRVVHHLACVAGDTVYGVHNPTAVNVIRGVSERIFHVDYGQGFTEPIRPSSVEFRSGMRRAEAYLRRRSPQLDKYSHEQFLACYDDVRKRKRYEDAIRSLEGSPITASDAHITTFVKAEKVNFSAKKDPAPRIISPRDPRYNVELGLFIKPIEGVLYRLLDEMCGGKTVMKGLNSVEVGQAVWEAWSEFEDPVAVPADAMRLISISTRKR